MAWGSGATGSRVFRAFLANLLTQTTAYDLDTHTIKAALFNNTATPDENAAGAAAGYAVGTWLTGNEVFEAGQWAAGGVALTGPSVNSGTADVVFFTASNTASGSAADLADVRGVLVYDDTITVTPAPIADPGICYNSFGGQANAVTNGTFTIVWNALGIFRATV